MDVRHGPVQTLPRPGARGPCPVHLRAGRHGLRPFPAGVLPPQEDQPPGGAAPAAGPHHAHVCVVVPAAGEVLLAGDCAQGGPAGESLPTCTRAHLQVHGPPRGHPALWVVLMN